MSRLAGHDGLLLVAVVLAVVSVGMAQQDQQKVEKAPVEQSGNQWFMAYCASCHGEDAKGNGQLAQGLEQPPTDLTALAKRNNGKFPADYVKKVLVHGINLPGHGTNDMPVWGRTFADINARELIQYLESVQVK